MAFPGDRLDRAALVADRDVLNGYSGPDWTMHEIALVSSQWSSGGGYRVLGTWPFA